MKMQSRNQIELQNLNLEQQACSDFTSFLDSIYYEGYAEQLASANPEAFTEELNLFFDNYFSHVR
ncbi:hypothetical protein BH11BAC1_BH11BAC1_29840 [soil metagenome]